MSILYPHEHKLCYNYAGKNNHFFEILEVGASGCRTSSTSNKIGFITRGECTLRSDFIEMIHVAEGDSIFFPPGSQCTLTSADTARLILVRVDDVVNICDGLALEELFDLTVDPSMCIIKVHKRIMEYLEHVVKILEDGLNCTKLMELKSLEVMYLFSAYHRKENLAAFFHHVLSRDMRFAARVNQYWLRSKSVNELAAYCNYSAKGFGKKFKQVFSKTPYQWLSEKKSSAIYYELVNTDMSIKEIADRYRFNSVQHFNEYCIKNLGKPPGFIKKKGRIA